MSYVLLYVVSFLSILVITNLTLSSNKGGVVVTKGLTYISTPTPTPIYDKEIYIFGSESSGTRYLSREVAKMLDSTLRWDGERPACKRVARGNKVVHVSVPWGMTCNGEINVLPSFDACDKVIVGRQFTNITHTLLSKVNRKAILIFREKEYSIKSIIKHHCFLGREVAFKEYDMAMTLMHDAIDYDFGDRLMVVKYEELGNILEWKKIAAFLGVGLRKTPRFKNGNV